MVEKMTIIFYSNDKIYRKGCNCCYKKTVVGTQQEMYLHKSSPTLTENILNNDDETAESLNYGHYIK